MTAIPSRGEAGRRHRTSIRMATQMRSLGWRVTPLTASRAKFVYAADEKSVLGLVDSIEDAKAAQKGHETRSRERRNPRRWNIGSPSTGFRL